ncbi:MAG: hypothetical protein KatS3mg131_3708 [Candidatus Tectimicrobiota bacterium]|nr:MAG: hypothetical protein KatS3mg131_3708 [Candidatus Tectomicrobia bacterium]
MPYYIPERLRHGYGLHAEAIRQLAAAGVRVLITVDCGITAQEEVALAQQLGIDVIITDHHQPPAVLPPALAVLNPHQPACPYPNKDLCGVGVVFKLLTALRAALRQAGLFGERLPNLKRHLDLVTLGTIADVTPLRGENRILVYHGLQELTRTRKPGLQALRQLSGRSDKPASTREVGFYLAPRLNASGRLDSAAHSVALLTAADAQAAAPLAAAIEAVNAQRRTLQQEIEAAVHARLARDYDGRPPAAIVLADAAWHPGVVGIVAAKIAQAYYRPTLLLHLDGDTARGSGRSIPAFDLYAALHHCARWLRQYGGHPQAAGLTLDAAHLPRLQQELVRYTQATLSPAALQPTLELEARVTLDELTPEVVAQLASLAPPRRGQPGAAAVCPSGTVPDAGAARGRPGAARPVSRAAARHPPRCRGLWPGRASGGAGRAACARHRLYARTQPLERGGARRAARAGPAPPRPAVSGKAIDTVGGIFYISTNSQRQGRG